MLTLLQSHASKLALGNQASPLGRVLYTSARSCSDEISAGSRPHDSGVFETRLRFILHTFHRVIAQWFATPRWEASEGGATLAVADKATPRDGLSERRFRPAL